MRIRKNAKVSPLLYSGYALKHETLLQTHLCQLNQSPWDVITFPPDSQDHPSSPPLLPSTSNQVGGDDSFTAANGSFEDSIGLVESVASLKNSFDGDEDMKEEGDLKWSYGDRLALAENHDGFMMKNEDADSYREPDGKGWQCRRKTAKEGRSSGECHSLSIIGCNNITSPKKSDKLSEVKRRPRLKKASASSSVSNPYEFYYYSGFGPLWGKRRGPSRVQVNNKVNTNDTLKNLEIDEAMTSTVAVPITPSSSSSQIDDDEFDYVDDDEDDDDDGDTGKKRARKPIKARSLKSLM